MDMAKDIVQDAFENLWIRKDSVNMEKVKSYLFTTVYNKSIDNFRKGGQMQLVPIENLDWTVAKNEYADFEEKQMLFRALEKLSATSRALLVLRDLEGYSYNELEEITGLNESQVKTYLFRARKSLKEEILKLEVQWKG